MNSTSAAGMHQFNQTRLMQACLNAAPDGDHDIMSEIIQVVALYSQPCMQMTLKSYPTMQSWTQSPTRIDVWKIPIRIAKILYLYHASVQPFEPTSE